MGVEELIGFANGIGGGSNSGSNKILTWILIFVIVFGFGNGKKCLNNFKECEVTHESSSHSQHRRHRSRCQNERCNVNNGIGNIFGNNGMGNVLGSNWVFILVIVGLLFLCRNKKETTTTTTTTD